jgi:hypothetical protein
MWRLMLTSLCTGQQGQQDQRDCHSTHCSCAGVNSRNQKTEFNNVAYEGSDLALS